MVKRVVSLLAAVFMVCASSFSVSAWSADSFVADSSNYYKLFPSTFSVQAVSDSSDSSSFLDINSLFDLGHWDCDGFAFWVTCHNDGYDSLPGYPDIEPYDYNVLIPLSGISPSFSGSGSSVKRWSVSYSIPDSWNSDTITQVFVPGFTGASSLPVSYSCDFLFDISSFGSFSAFEVSGYLYMVPVLLFNGSQISQGTLESIDLIVDGDSVAQWILESPSSSFDVPSTIISRPSAIQSIGLRFVFNPTSPFSYQSGSYEMQMFNYNRQDSSDLSLTVIGSDAVLDAFTDEAQDSINQHDQIEADWVGQMDENFNSLDLDTASYPSGLVSGFQLLSGIFMDIWNGLGDLHLIFTIPLTLGIVLVLIGRISKAVSNRSGRAEEKGDNSA